MGKQNLSEIRQMQDAKRNSEHWEVPERRLFLIKPTKF